MVAASVTLRPSRPAATVQRSSRSGRQVNGSPPPGALRGRRLPPLAAAACRPPCSHAPLHLDVQAAGGARNMQPAADAAAPPAAPSRRQLLAGAVAAAAAAVAPLPARAEATNVIDGQGQTFLVPQSAVAEFTAAQKQLLEYNLRTQRQNNAPLDFPAFIREG